jgi:hypothetical protein
MADKKWALVLGAVCCLYFLLLLRFYLVRYDVPDYFLYHRFGVEGLAAKDGFSSLFIWLSKYNTRYPLAYHLAPLACLSAALFALNYAFGVLDRAPLDRKLFLGVSLSSGIWYYFAGKVFYEFPFVALSVALSSLAIVAVIRVREEPAVTSGAPLLSRAQRRYRGLALGLLGFALSFKPHGVFVVFGLLLLLAVSRQGRSFYRTRHHAREWLASSACFVAGYLVGNYNLPFRFEQTIAGLRAYPAQSDLYEHLFGDSRLVWDHVSMPSFDSGALSVIAAGLILFVLPLLLDNRLYLLVNVAMTAAYAAFITSFSPGYVWHAFPFCLFTLLSLAFMLAESERLKPERRSSFRGVLGAALAVQVYTHFLGYLPQQIAASEDVREAGAVLERNSASINRKLLELAGQLDGSFTVKLTFKFARPVTDDLAAPEQNPLEVGDPNGWRAVVTHPGYSDAGREHAYLVFVEPSALLRLSSYIAERRDDQLPSFEFEGYRIGYYRVE